METIAFGETVEVTLDGVARVLKTFPQLSVDALQHPDDRDASQALEGIPLFPELYRKFKESSVDQVMRMQHLTAHIRVGPDLGAQLYKKFVLAARILDIPQLPELYIGYAASVNAYAGGMSRPLVNLASSMVSTCNDAELLAVIGHELGHIKCRHMLNQSLFALFATGGAENLSGLFPIVGQAAFLGIRFALQHWMRMAEFSCDRAALLVVQDPKVVASMLAKLAGFHQAVMPDFTFEAVLRQMEEYDRYNEGIVQTTNKVMLFLQRNMQGNSLYDHPMPVLRIRRILDWGKSDHYNDIITGKYARQTTASPVGLIDGDSAKCAQCGSFSAPGATFCSHCGTRL